MVKAETLKSLCAHFMGCVYKKLLTKHTRLIQGKIQQTILTDGFLHHGFICRIVFATPQHHGEDPTLTHSRSCWNIHSD
jgi:hypothetical protein